MILIARSFSHNYGTVRRHAGRADHRRRIREFHHSTTLSAATAAVSVYVADETGSFLWRNIGRTVVVRFQLVARPVSSLFLSLSFLLSGHVCVSLFHRWNLSFFQRRNTANRRKEALSSSRRKYYENQTVFLVFFVWGWPSPKNPG